MNLNKLKLAIVGLGEQAVDNLIPALILNRYTRIIAICDIDNSKLETIGDKIDISEEHRYLSYKDMISKEKPDVLVVSSFPEVHYQVAKYAISMGIHVFVEKPPVSNLEQLKELITMSLEKKVRTGVGMNFSYTDSHRLLTDIISESDFGAVSFVSVEHISSKPVGPLWHFDSITDSFLLAQLIHPLDYLLSLGGKIQSLRVYCSEHQKPFIIQVMIEFHGGIVGCLKSGAFYPRFRHEVEVISNNGSMVRICDLSHVEVTKKEIVTPFNIRAKNCHTVYTPSPLKSGYSKSGYSFEFDAFFEHILLEKQYRHSFEQMLPVYEAMELIKNEIDFKTGLNNDATYNHPPKLLRLI